MCLFPYLSIAVSEPPGHRASRPRDNTVYVCVCIYIYNMCISIAYYVYHCSICTARASCIETWSPRTFSTPKRAKTLVCAYTHTHTHVCVCVCVKYVCVCVCTCLIHILYNMCVYIHICIYVYILYLIYNTFNQFGFFLYYIYISLLFVPTRPTLSFCLSNNDRNINVIQKKSNLIKMCYI